ncbi:MAG: hypothetical protein DRO09_01950, partial [Thermoprotei archaeon]
IESSQAHQRIFQSEKNNMYPLEELGIFRKTGNLGPLAIPDFGTVEPKQTRQWTFMVYLDAANNLEGVGIEDFLEMSSVGSTTDVAIIVLMDRISGYDTSYGDWTDTRIFYVEQGDEPYDTTADESWGERNMGDPQTIVDFVTWCVANYPAEHYALILWDHGGGLSGVCWDEDNGDDNINLFELRNALETIYTDLGMKLDILGFDACLMGMIEVAYQCRDYVDYIVFSQEYEPGDGWPYDDILDPLVNNPAMSPADFAVLIAQKYVESYNGGSQGTDTYATQSAINISALETVTFRKLDRIIGELIRDYDIYSTAISNAVSNAESFDDPEEKDLIHFLVLLKGEVSDPDLVNLIDETVDAVNASIMYGGHLSGHPNAHGLSAFFPSDYYTDYNDILMSIHHQWDEFTMKRTGNSVDLWSYDITFSGSDSDGNGYYDSGTVYADLDSDNSQSVYVKVYGYDGVAEYYMGKSALSSISGGDSGDIISIDLDMPSTPSIYALRFEMYDSSDTLVDQLYYYCDDDVSDLPLEYMPGYPVVKIVNPTSGSTINGTILLQVNATDEDGISWVKVEIGGAWYDMTYNPSSGLYEYNWDTTKYDDGSIQIRVNASDTGGNMTSVTATYTIDNIGITIIQPCSGDKIRDTIRVKAEVVLKASGASIDSVITRLENDTYNGSLVLMTYNSTSGYYEADLDTTQYSDGQYSLVVYANQTSGGMDKSAVDVEVDNEIAPILLVDDDTGDSYETYYIQALTDLGYQQGKDFEVWSVASDGSVTSDLMYGRDVVIWFTGDDYTSTLSASDRSVIGEYLDDGGSLFISGQDIGYDIYNDDPMWFETYLRAVYESDDTNTDTVTGTSGSIFDGVSYSLSDGDGAGNNNYPSDISPTGGSTLAMYYGTDSSLGAAVTYEGVFHLVYFAFPFEAINSASDRADCMQKILDFLMPVPGKPSVSIVNPEDGDLVIGSVLVQANATDEDGTITSVVLKVDGSYYGDMTYNPSNGLWEITLDVSSLSFGSHTLTVEATDNNGNAALSSVTVFTKSATTFIIVIDDDEGENYEQYYTSALNDLGYGEGVDYDLWRYNESGTPSLELLSAYDLVIWFTGKDYSTTLTAGDRDLLAGYLDGGGSLFISGQDIGFDIYNDNITWFQTYLKAIYEADDTNIDNVTGLSGTIFEGKTYLLSGGDGAGNNNYPSDISPTGGSSLALCYGEDQTLGAAVTYSGVFRLVYFAFPFEAINSATDRSDCMETILNFRLSRVEITSPTEDPSTGEAYIGGDDVVISWTASGSIDHYEILVNGTSYGNTTGTDYVIKDLSEGVWNITVIAHYTDGSSSGDYQIIIIDLTSPTLSPDTSIEIASESQASITISWSASDTLSGIDHYEVYVNGVWTNVGTSTSYTIDTSSMSDGTYVVYIRAFDNAGHATQSIVLLIVDRTPPSLNVLYPEDDDVIASNTVVISWEATDGIGVDHYEISIDGGSWINIGRETSHTASGLLEGSHTIYIRAYDVSGNYVEVSVGIIVDLTDPDLSIVSPTDGDVITSSSVTISWQSTSTDIAYYLVRLDDGSWINVGLSTSYTFSGVSSGVHVAYVIAVDDGGRTTMKSTVFIVSAVAGGSSQDGDDPRDVVEDLGAGMDLVVEVDIVLDDVDVCRATGYVASAGSHEATSVESSSGHYDSVVHD